VEFLDTISEMRVQQTEAIVSLQGEVRRLREDVNKLQDTLLETFKLGSGRTPQ
jgi:polyhydroxyalkanoate synthesis regulator phasin